MRTQKSSELSARSDDVAGATLSPSRERRRWPALVLFGTSTFLFWACLYLYVPILPAYAESQGAGLSMVGAVVGSYAIAQLLLRAPLGIWTDFLGRRKPFVAAGLVFASAGALTMAVASGPWLIFAGRTVTGVGAATWVVSSVFFASYFPSDRSARGIGIISFVNSVAIVAATSIGGQLAEAWGPESVFFVGAALGLLGVLCLVPVAEPAVYRPPTAGYETFLRVATNPLLLTASLMSMLVHFASAATISSFTLVYASRLGASSSELGLVSAAYLGAATLATLGAVYLMERRSYSSNITLGAVAMGGPLLVTPLVTRLGPFLLIQLVTGAGRGLINTALMALSISNVPASHRATAMGVYQALYAIGMMAGPALGGVAAETLGLSSVFLVSGASVLLAGALAGLRRLPEAALTV